MKRFCYILTLIALPLCSIAAKPDAGLLDTVQRQTLRYFWDFAHPACGMARERSNVTPLYGNEVVTTGGSGFGIMAMIAGVERGFINRRQAVERMGRIVSFLASADRYHGAFPHWLDGTTGKTVNFSKKDNGGDLVETAFLMQGLLAARQYYGRRNAAETALRASIDSLWRGVEWQWYTRGGEDRLYWHWSADYGWAMNHAIRGWDECLITYILAAASPTHPIDAAVYHKGWTDTDHFVNGKQYYGITLPLGFDYGGPLFFSHYSFLGLDPRGLKDRYADYWRQNVAHTLINRAYCVDNPAGWKGYGPGCWGLTSSDDPKGYGAHSPTNDNGTISPTAAVSAIPYAPGYAIEAMRRFLYGLDGKIWGEYGFTDAFNVTEGWYSDAYLAIDQGPQVVMIENHRSGLLWDLFMSHPDVQRGLRALDFDSPHLKMKN